VNRLKLTPALMRCLSTINIIENPNGAVRRVASRVSRWRDADIVMRLISLAHLEAEKYGIQGYCDLWVLCAALGRSKSTSKIGLNTKAA